MLDFANNLLSLMDLIKLILNNHKYFLIILLTLFSIFVFFGFGGSFPPGVNHDASEVALIAIELGEKNEFVPYIYWRGPGHESMFHYSVLLFFNIFGINRYSLELTSMFFGMVSLIGFYLLSHSISEKGYLAKVVSILYAVSTVLLTFSRTGWYLITLMALLPFCLYSYERFNKDRSNANAVLIGILTGLMCYTYNAGRIVPVLFIFFWVIKLINSKNRKTILKQLIMSTVGLFVILLPLLIFIFNNFALWMGRATSFYDQKIFIFSDYLNNLWISLNFFNIDSNGLDFITSFPALEGPMLVLWLFGIITTFVYYKKYWMYLLIFFLMLLPGILTSPSIHRAVGSLPVIYIFVLIFFNVIEKNISIVVKDKYQPKFKAYSVMILILIVLLQLYASFDKMYIRQEPFKWGFYPEANLVAKYIKNKKLDTVVVCGDNWPEDILKFINIDGVNPINEDHFQNYENYNSDGHIPAINLIDDISSGNLQIEGKLFLVDTSQNDIFIEYAYIAGLNPFIVDELYYNNSDGNNIIAYVYTMEGNY